MTKISAIITAGGTSSRFGSDKLLEKIDGKTVIETTTLKFLDIVDEIIIPTKKETKDYIKSLNLSNKIKFTANGKTRQQSVYNGLLCCSSPDIVLIHDGARPFIKKDLIKKIIDLTPEKKAVVLGVFAIDTIKEVENGKIIKTIDRKKIFQAQTPQAFEFNLIKNIHEKYKNFDYFTDDSSMLENEGINVYILEGDKSNFKITTKEDLS